MTKKQLSKEYAKVMLEAEEALGRKEAISLFKKAHSIKKKLYQYEDDYPLIHNG